MPPKRKQRPAEGAAATRQWQTLRRNEREYSGGGRIPQYRRRPVMAAAVMWSIANCGGQVRR